MLWMIVGVVTATVLLAGGVWLGMTYRDGIGRGVDGGRAGTGGVSAAGVGQFYTCSMHPQVLQDHPGKCPICHMDLEPVRAAATGGEKQERKVAYWTDPTYSPPYVPDKPGKSPAGVDLLPVYEDQVSAGPSITIDPVIVQNMGVRVAKVEKAPLRRTLRVVGTLVEPEQNHVEINLRVSGWIQKLYANQEGMPVKKGDKLFDLYSTELTAAADDLINARKAVDASGVSSDAVVQGAGRAMVDAARRKLELLGLAAADVDAIAKLDKAPETVSFTSPMTGHVVDKAVVEGASVKAGERVMRIADRSSMWLQMQVYEQQLPLVHVGTPVRAQINGFPGHTFDGAVEFIYPHLDMMTRTATARTTLANEGHALHEGMYATVEIDAEAAASAILVPREAVIDSGTRQIVFLAQGGGHFEARQVTIGQTGRSEGAGGDDMVQVLTGLAGNETVVTSGQFLLDSESRMREAIEKHLRDRVATPSTDAALSAAQGAVPDSRPASAVGATDDLFAAYLALQRSLVGADKPVQAGTLASAATVAAGRLPAGEARDLAGEIAAEALELQPLPLDKQRETFKTMSAAAIKLAAEAPPSATSAAIYEFHCPMAQANWLQTGDQTANPYLADMMTCGSMVRKIAGPGPETRP
jgi:RND family efflux transporter MFP subunit